MRQIATAADLWSTLDSATVRGYAVGLLPDDVAPPTAVVWAECVTLGQAIKAYSAAMLRTGADYTDADGAAELLAGHILIDPEQWLATDGAEPVCDPKRLRVLFQSAADVLGMGSPTDTNSVGHALMMTLAEVSGLGAFPETEAPADLAGSIERLRNRGQWVTGCLPQDPEAALWVTPYTEGQRQQAYESCLTPVRDDVKHANAPAHTRTLLSFVLRTGPGGPPLLTATECERLPYGGARLLDFVSTSLTTRIGGARQRTGFQRSPAEPMAKPRGASHKGVVRNQALAPTAVAGDGDA